MVAGRPSHRRIDWVGLEYGGHLCDSHPGPRQYRFQSIRGAKQIGDHYQADLGRNAGGVRRLERDEPFGTLGVDSILDQRWHCRLPVVKLLDPPALWDS